MHQELIDDEALPDGLSDDEAVLLGRYFKLLPES